MTSEPNMRKLEKIVVPEVKASWKYLAYSMGYEPRDVKPIECDSKDVEDRCTRLFEDWLTTDHGDTPRTWEKLLERIEEVDCLHAAAGHIKEKLIKQ